MAFYPSPTQLLTANANEATTYETIIPHTTRGLTGRGTIVELPARIGQMGIPPLEQPPFVECTCLRFSLHTFCVVDLHVDLNYCRSVIWCEAMLLVVNMVTCPIGTDCGGRFAYWELHTVLYASSKIWKCHFKLHAQSQLQCGTMKTSEFMTTQVELIDPTNLMDLSTTLYLALGWCFCKNVCARVVYSGRGAQVKLGYTGNVW